MLALCKLKPIAENKFSVARMLQVFFDSVGNSIFCYSDNFFFLPITRQQILDASKLEEFADDNFKFEENGRQLSERVENTVGKGEIARYEQFLLFPQCFNEACFPGASKGVILWEWVKGFFPSNVKSQDCVVKSQMWVQLCR